MVHDAHQDALAQLFLSAPHLHDLLVAERASLSTERTAFSAERTSLNERIASLEKERDNLRASHERLRQELELFKRRLFIAKAERKDTRELEAEFGEKMRQLDLLAGTLGIAQREPEVDAESVAESEVEPKESASPEVPKRKELAKDGKPLGKRRNNRGKGRRDLRTLPLPEERIEIRDPHLETLVAQGLVVPNGFETTYKAGHRRGGKVRIAIARVRYKTVASDAEGKVDVINAPMPEETLPSSLLAPSLASHVIHENVGKGLPLFRIEDALERDGIAISRSTLARCKYLVGTKLGDTVVKAMHAHALATAFCISTDATGVNIQPIYSREKGRQPCKKGNFLVMIADKEHIIFEYLEKETGRAIHSKFRGFNGYVQADAKSVFNLLFADEAELQRKAPDLKYDGCTRSEVGCWYHCRRRVWEAAVAKCAVGREGLVRIARIFELDASWKDKPPSEIKCLRDQYLRPHVDAFFAWVEEQRPLHKDRRGYTRTALEYANNHRESLTRFFEDGRLVLSNNGAERAIKAIALGRKCWLFCGSDDHAKSTAALYSLVASARLHRLDVEDYLRCLIRLVPLWPADRMLELAPLFWERTRARLDPKALAQELGPIDIPVEPLDTSAPTEQQTAAG